MTDHKADSAEFERWCAETYRSQAYLHTSATSGEWEAWQAGAAAMQARCAAQPADPSMDTTLRNAARRSATIVDRGRLVQPVEPVAWRWRFKHNGQWGDWEHYAHKPTSPSSDTFQMEPLYAATPASAAVPLTKPRCRECAKWVKEQADSKEWMEGVVRGREIIARLAAAGDKS